MTNLLQVGHAKTSIPIFHTIIHDYENINKSLKEIIIEHRQKFPEDTQSNVKAWHSAWNTHEINPKFQPLIEIVLNGCKFIDEGYNEGRGLKYFIKELWAMMYEKDDWTKRHAHYPTHFACCYYVEVEPNCAPIIFASKVNDGKNNDNEPFILQPKDGLLAIWPGHLHHEIPQTLGKRMCVSMNIGAIDPSQLNTVSKLSWNIDWL